MEHQPLELLGYEWLRYVSKCMIVVTERSPREWATGRPDLLGITKGRYLVEIEIKRSMSDFRANSKKTHISYRNQKPLKETNGYPRQFYYLIPHRLAEPATLETPEWAGLMSVGENGINAIKIIKKAPVNKGSRKLTLKECVYMACAQSNLTASQMRSIHEIRCNYGQSFWQWKNCDYDI